MSRRIDQPAAIYNEQDRTLKNTDGGKLLFTVCRDIPCAALMQGNRLLAVQTLPDKPSLIGTVYIGRVQKIITNIGACFVEIADKEIGFLPLKEASAPFLCNRTYDGRLLQGDELLVQVTRDAQKGKQLSLTTAISLANDYFVLSMGSSRTGFSGKLEETRKKELRDWLAETQITVGGKLSEEYLAAVCDSVNDINLPATGLVVRTKTQEADADTLTESLQTLAAAYCRMFAIASHRTCFSCLKEPDSPVNAVFDQMVSPREYCEIVTDDEVMYHSLSKLPWLTCADRNTQAGTFDAPMLRLYQDAQFSLTKLYGLDAKLDTALKPRVWLRSGGFLVIETTEAMTVIDVNSGKYEAKKGMYRNAQEYYAAVNAEAAQEIALQLRLRNLSGIIIVDFINMKEAGEQEKLLALLRRLVKADKQKTTVVDITPLGLVEITRKKTGRPLAEQFRVDRGSQQE